MSAICTRRIGNISVLPEIGQYLSFVLPNDIIIEFKGRHLSQFLGETQLGF